MSKYKPNIIVEFDGPIHSYTSGWKGVDAFPDPITPGAERWLATMREHFTVNIVSPRFRDKTAIEAAQDWFDAHTTTIITDDLKWLSNDALPPYLMYVSDRAFRFTGAFPTVDEIRSFKPVRGEQRGTADAALRDDMQTILAIVNDLHTMDEHCELGSDEDEITCPACLVGRIVRKYVRK